VTLHRERLRVPGVRAERTERREPTTTASLLDLSDLSRGEVSRTSLLILRHIPPAHRLITRAGLLEAVRVHQVPLRSPEDQRLHDRRSVLRIRPSRRPVVTGVLRQILERTLSDAGAVILGDLIHQREVE